MKCNKCYQIIKDKEEIKESRKYYCESCHKSESWARTGSQIVLVSSYLMVIVLAIIVLIYIWKETFKKEPREKTDD